MQFHRTKRRRFPCTAAPRHRRTLLPISAARTEKEHAMATGMGPPPPKNPTADGTAAEPSTSESTNGSAMAPPPPRNPNPPEPESASEPSVDRQIELESNPPSSDAPENSDQVSNASENPSSASAKGGSKLEQQNSNSAVPYKIPPWSGPPGHEFFLEVLKDGAIISRYDVLVVLSFLYQLHYVCSRKALWKFWKKLLGKVLFH